MNFYELRNIIKYIKEKVQCPNCKGSFGYRDIGVVGTYQKEGILHAHCPDCKANILVNIILVPEGKKPNSHSVRLSPEKLELNNNSKDNLEE